MPTNFPASLDSFTTKTNNVDTIDASHVNNLQDATLAIETLLGAQSNRSTSWTPTVFFSTNNTGVTYTSDGFYARMGGIVFIYGELQITAKGSASGDLRITNAPVTALPNTNCSFTCAYVVTSWTTFQPEVARIQGGQNIIDFYYVGQTVTTRITAAHVQTNSALRFSGFYFHA